MQPPMIIAHRTCPLDAAENSLAGLREAGRLQADAVEIDLRVSLDGKPYLMHDWTIRRTTGLNLPMELVPSLLLNRLRIQGTDETVPSLGSALNALPEGMKLAIDVKTPWAIVPLVRYLKRFGMESRALIWCQSPYACMYAVKFAKDAEVAYLKTTNTRRSALRFLHRAQHLGVQAVSAHWLALTPEFAAEASARGLRLYSYNEQYDLDAAKIALLDGVITDHVLRAREIAAALPS